MGRTKKKRKQPRLESLRKAISLGTPQSMPPVMFSDGHAKSAGNKADATAELEAYIAWSVHLHEEIHNYVRTYQTIFQLLAALVAAGVAAFSQSPTLRDPFLIALPYIVNLGLVQWATSLREIMTCAASIDVMEARVREASGRWILFHETAVALRPPNRLGSALNNATYVVVLMVSWTVGVGLAARTMQWPYLVAYIAFAILSTLSLLVNFAEVAKSRGTMRRSIAQLEGTETQASR